MSGSDLQHAREFPEQVVAWVEEGRWEELATALSSGLPATLYSESYGLSLFEFVVCQPEGLLELARDPDRALPLSLLEAFLSQASLDTLGTDGGRGWLSAALRGGQWAWGERLLEWGWPGDEATAEGGAMHALLRGVARRRQLRALVSVGQVFQELLEPLDEGKGTLGTLDGEIFFKRLVERLSSRGRQEGELVHQVQALEAVMGAGASLTQAGRSVRRTALEAVWPLHQALLIQEVGLVSWLLDAHARTGDPLPPSLLSFAVSHTTLPGLRAVLSHPVVRGLPLAELSQAAFESVGRPLPGVLVALEEAGLDLGACRDGEGWDLMQRAAEAGAVPALLVMLARGPGLEEGRAVGPSPADLLRLHQPDLCEVLGVSQVVETPKVRLLRPRR